jgi:hypothetical protein
LKNKCGEKNSFPHLRSEGKNHIKVTSQDSSGKLWNYFTKQGNNTDQKLLTLKGRY